MNDSSSNEHRSENNSHETISNNSNLSPNIILSLTSSSKWSLNNILVPFCLITYLLIKYFKKYSFFFFL